MESSEVSAASAQRKSRLLLGIIIGLVVVALVAVFVVLARMGRASADLGNSGGTGSAASASATPATNADDAKAWIAVTQDVNIPNEPDHMLSAGGKYLLLNGFCGKDRQPCSASYDIASDLWSKLPIVPQGWDSEVDGVTSIVVVDDILYLVGIHEPENGKSSWLLSSYDPVRDVWKKLPAPKIPVDDNTVATVAVNGGFMLSSGMYEEDCDDNAEAKLLEPSDVIFLKYDVATKSWSKPLKSPEPLNSCDVAPAFYGLGNYVYYSARTAIWLLDVETSKWQQLTGAPFKLVNDTFPEHPADVVTTNGKFYFMDELASLDPTTGEWGHFSRPEETLESQNRFLALGFLVGSRIEWDNYLVDPEKSEWTQLPQLPGPESIKYDPAEIESEVESGVEVDELGEEVLTWNATGDADTIFACSPRTSSEELGTALGLTVDESGTYPSACYYYKVV